MEQTNNRPAPPIPPRPTSPPPSPPRGDKVVSIGNWILTALVMCIPVANFVMAIVWAAGAESKSKRNLFRAYWICLAIFWSLVIIAVFVVPGLFAWLSNAANSITLG